MYSISFLRTTKQERKNDTKFKLISLFKLHFTMRFSARVNSALCYHAFLSRFFFYFLFFFSGRWPCIVFIFMVFVFRLDCNSVRCDSIESLQFFSFDTRGNSRSACVNNRRF